MDRFNIMLAEAQYNSDNTKICAGFEKSRDNVRCKCRHLICNNRGLYSCALNIQCGFWCTSFVQMGVYIGSKLHPKNSLCPLPLRI